MVLEISLSATIPASATIPFRPLVMLITYVNLKIKYNYIYYKLYNIY